MFYVGVVLKSTNACSLRFSDGNGWENKIGQIFFEINLSLLRSQPLSPCQFTGSTVYSVFGSLVFQKLRKIIFCLFHFTNEYGKKALPYPPSIKSFTTNLPRYTNGFHSQKGSTYPICRGTVLRVLVLFVDPFCL